MEKKNKTYTLTTLLTVASLFLVIGFVGGYYSKSLIQRRAFDNFRNENMSQRGQMGNQYGQMGNSYNNGNKNINPTAGMGQQKGEVTEVNEKNITVKYEDGSSKIIVISNSTMFSGLVKKEIKDIKVGSKIFVFGKGNSDGSLTADTIQLDN